MRARSRPSIPDIEAPAERAIEVAPEETAPLIPLQPRVSKPAPESLAGATMDIPPSSSKLVEDKRSVENDAELLAWAKKRGWVTFLFFFTCALIVAVTTWLLLR